MSNIVDENNIRNNNDDDENENAATAVAIIQTTIEHVVPQLSTAQRATTTPPPNDSGGSSSILVSLPTYKDQVRPHHQQANVVVNKNINYHNRKEPQQQQQQQQQQQHADDHSTQQEVEVFASVIPIADAIYTTDHIPRQHQTSTTPTIIIPATIESPHIVHQNDSVNNCKESTTSGWNCTTRISILIICLIVTAVIVIPSVIVCVGNNDKCLRDSRSVNSNTSTAPTSAPITTEATPMMTNYFLDDLNVLQTAVDDYYTALELIDTTATTTLDDESIYEQIQDVPVIRQYGYPISKWDVSRVTNFTSLFDGKRNARFIYTFNENLNHWNVSSAIDMFRMFGKLNIYEGIGLEDWDVSNVINMRSMFQENYNFHGNISRWNIQKVRTLTRIFSDCYRFNTNISTWKTSNVNSMAWMFFDARSFNQDISSWDVSKVEDFSDMFLKALVFNQNISGWKVTSSKEMLHMFEDTLEFNQDLSAWDVRNNRNFFMMFARARSYNHSLCDWRTKILASANVTGMFNVTSCLNTSDPISGDGVLLSDGPFCHPCT